MNTKLALLAGEQTCTQAVQYYLDQIKKHQALNAYLEVYAEEALLLAKELDNRVDQKKLVGKLHGVVIGKKDVLLF
jgi:aspartyl-tRNA(Asn)/glutamyl-tRNA(Gln) amidotransferase subunit A